MKTVTCVLHIDPSDIAYLKFILEGYDGLGNLTTIDHKAGIIAVHTPAPMEDEIRLFLDHLASEVTMRHLAADTLDAYKAHFLAMEDDHA